jgi:amino-acid N-acetyltransferase
MKEKLGTPEHLGGIENERDIDEVWELIHQGYLEGNLQPREKNEIADLRDNFIVSRFKGEVIGVVGLDVYTKRLAEIRSLYVRRDFRGFGIGTTLVNEALLRASEQGIPEVIAITDKIDMFKKAGFHEILNGQQAMFLRL